MEKFFELTSNIASILAILTFLYAIWIERKLEKFKLSVLFNTRVEPLVNQLKENNSKLSRLLEGFSGQEREVKAVFANINGILSDIKPKLSKNLQSDIQSIKGTYFNRRTIKFISGDKPKKEWWKIFSVYFNEDDLENLYVSIDSLSNRIENSIDDYKVLP